MISTDDSRPQSSPRPRELQDLLNFHLYHPLAWRLAKALVPTPITPNMVSIAGGLCVVAAAFAYAVPGWPLPALAGMLLHMTWHVVDGADGDLARLTGRTSPLGEMIDGVCDYSGHIVLYVVLAWVLCRQIDPAAAWALTLITGASHVAQSNHFEVQRRQYLWWAYGTPWLRNAPDNQFEGQTSFAAFQSGYLKLANRLSPQMARIDASVAVAASDPPRLEALRALVRQRATMLLPGWHLLSNNHRTVTLGLSMLAGSPIYFFVYQAVVLNVVLARSIARFNAAASRLGDEIDQLPPASTLR